MSSSTAVASSAGSTTKPAPLGGVGEQGEHAVADDVDGRLVAGHQQERGGADQLVGIEVRCDEVADQVVAGVRAAVRRQLAQGVDELRGRPAPRRARRPSPGSGSYIATIAVDQPRSRGRTLLRQPEQLGDDLDRQHVRDGGHEVGRAGEPGTETASSATSRSARARTAGSSRAVCPRLNAPATSVRSRSCGSPSRSSRELRCSRLNAGNSVGRLGVDPDPPERAAAQDLRARGVRHGDGHAQQRVLVHRGDRAQRRERGVRIVEEGGVGGVERHGSASGGDVAVNYA